MDQRPVRYHDPEHIEAVEIPADGCAYESVGDWWHAPGRKLMTATVDTGNIYANGMIQIHEMVEALWCLKHGVTPQSVDKADLDFEATHPPDDAEPGEVPTHPCHVGHMCADAIERTVCQMLGIRWDEYADIVAAADKKIQKAVAARKK